LGSLLNEIFPQYQLSVAPVTLSMALSDPEQPAVLFYAERWDPDAIALLQRLRATTPHVYAICPAAADPATCLAILKSGVREAASDTPPALHTLALKLQRCVREPEPWQWQLGDRLFVPGDGCLYHQRERIALTPTEARMLRRLCLAGGMDPPGKLTVDRLVQELWVRDGTTASVESSIRNYIAKLRHKLGEDSKHPRVLQRDRWGYWLILGPLAKPCMQPDRHYCN